MTFCIFNSAANNLIDRFIVRSADDIAAPHRRADPLNPPEIAKYLHKPDAAPSPDAPTSETPSDSKKGGFAPILRPSDLVGRTFLLNKESGQHLRARIVKALDDCEGDLSRDSLRLHFICSMNDGTVEEVFTCNEILDHINNSKEEDLVE